MGPPKALRALFGPTILTLCVKNMTEPLYEKPILKYRVIFIAFTVIALLTPIILVVTPWLLEKESLENWFQRSGSLVVIFALVAESNAIAIFKILNPTGFPSTSFEEVRKQYDYLPNKYTKISLSVIGLGTLIWGYGDLVKCLFT